MTEFIEAQPVPRVCQTCTERIACIRAGEGEWCCDECDHLGERFIPVGSVTPPPITASQE